METDDNRKLMICRSCGNTYDYDYFGEENLLQAADKALADSNFSAAKDMYSFMLDKEPSNVKALRGLILATNKVNRLYDITLKIKSGTFIPGTLNLKKYRDLCDPDSARFFEKTDEILSLYQEYIELKRTMKELETEKEATEKKLRDENDLSYNYEDNEHLKNNLIVASVILALLIITAIILGTGYDTPSWLIVVFILGAIATIFYVLGILIKMRINKRSPENPLLTDLEEIDKKTEENNDGMNRVIRQINEVFKEMNSF